LIVFIVAQAVILRNNKLKFAQIILDSVIFVTKTLETGENIKIPSL